jgi:hypothetical protein
MAQVDGKPRSEPDIGPPYSESEPQAPDVNSPLAETETPIQALLPNLDRVSRSSFRKGTVSRHRINVALVVLGLVAVGATALIALAEFLF